MAWLCAAAAWATAWIAVDTLRRGPALDEFDLWDADESTPVKAKHSSEEIYEADWLGAGDGWSNGHSSGALTTAGSDSDEPSDCSKKIETFLERSHQLLLEFSGSCEFTWEEDFDSDNTIRPQALARMCRSPQCNDFASTVECPSGYEALLDECADEASRRDLKFSLPVYQTAVGVCKALKACSGMSMDPPNMSKSGECPDRSMVSHNCVRDGDSVSEEDCLRRGCCWEPSRRPGRNWCYRTASQVQCETQCPSEVGWKPRQREDCPAFSIVDSIYKDHPNPSLRRKACLDFACCWDPLEHGSLDPWCFQQPCLESASPGVHFFNMHD